MLAQIHEEIEAHYPGIIEMTDLFDSPTVHELAEHLAKRRTKAET